MIPSQKRISNGRFPHDFEPRRSSSAEPSQLRVLNRTVFILVESTQPPPHRGAVQSTPPLVPPGHASSGQRLHADGEIDFDLLEIMTATMYDAGVAAHDVDDQLGEMLDGK